jgi:hypothetical protein
MRAKRANSRRIFYLSDFVATVVFPCFLLLLSACRTSLPEHVTANDLVREYILLAVELGERDPDSLDFYVGSDPMVEKGRLAPEDIDSLHRSAVRLSGQVQALPESAQVDAQKKASLLAQIGAIILRTEQLQGKNRTFDEESHIFFGVVAPRDVDAGQRKLVRERLAGLLGKEKATAEAYSRFDARFIVPPNRVPAVLNTALQQCKTLTLEHMKLPAGEHVDIEYVFHKPWSAFSHYLGNAHSLIQINMDYPLTVDRILNLACHEGYPGHHVFNTMRDQTVIRGMHLDEFRVQPTFSPQSYLSEAAASYSPQLVLSSFERLHIERDLLFPIAGLKGLNAEQYLEVEDLVNQLHTAEPSIARDYLDGRLEWARSVDALEHEVLMEHGETFLLYLNEYRSYMLSYTLGSDAVQRFVEDGHPTDAERWRRYLSLMKNPFVPLPNH